MSHKDVMNCFCELVDCSTGEVYYNKNLGYAFNLNQPNDVGFTKLHELLQSAVRGSRLKRTPLQLRLTFTAPSAAIDLPFQDINELKTPYDIKPF